MRGSGKIPPGSIRMIPGIAFAVALEDVGLARGLLLQNGPTRILQEKGERGAQLVRKLYKKTIALLNAAYKVAGK